MRVAKGTQLQSLEGHRAEFRTVQSSFRVRQNGGVPGPPTYPVHPCVLSV